eukprot:3392119-Pyramimonas_sp.AAC.1
MCDVRYNISFHPQRDDAAEPLRLKGPCTKHGLLQRGLVPLTKCRRHSRLGCIGAQAARRPAPADDGGGQPQPRAHRAPPRVHHRVVVLARVVAQPVTSKAKGSTQQNSTASGSAARVLQKVAFERELQRPITGVDRRWLLKGCYKGQSLELTAGGL